MLGVDYNRAAQKELFDSADYYSQQKPDLGVRFLDEVEKCTQEIATSAKRYPIYFKDVRRCVVPQFPYGIYYRV